MKSFFHCATVALAAALLPGCFMFYQSPVRPPPGFIFSSYRAPVTTDFESTPALPSKKGSAHVTYFAVPFFGRWDFAFDGATVKEAAENGNITQVHYVDHEYLQVLGVFATYKTIVYGE